MKRIVVLFIATVMILGLCACGSASKTEAKNVDLTTLYESFSGITPEMFVMDDTTRLNFLGIDAADCKQVITATCVNGLLTDEIWLIEAKDAAALERIQSLADSRIKAKLFETESYAPDQYLIVEKGEIIVDGMYLALIVSTEVDTLKQMFEDALN